MKTILYFLLAIMIPYGCNETAGSNESPEDDSIEFYPLTPGAMDKNEFRYYHRLLSRFFDSTLIGKGFNGSILIAKDGNIIYENYYGLVDLRKKDSITAHTNFHIASTTKPFTGMAILRLVQEGKLSLHDSLNKFFPDLPYTGVTIKMLLCHRSGIPNYIYFADKGGWDKKLYVTNQDILNMLYNDEPQKTAAPGTAFHYSNTNFVLLAMIIEKITGLSYPVYLKQIFFQPLGMNNTYVFTLTDTLTATNSFTASGTHWQNDFLEGTYGDKNIHSTPRDLLKWDQALYKGQVVNQSLLDSAYTPTNTERPSSIFKYGLGWRLQVFPNGKRIIYHYGRWHGFNSAFARLTDEKITIIVMGNRFTRNIYNAAHDTYKLFGDYTTDQKEEENESEAKTIKRLDSSVYSAKKPRH